MIARLRSRLSYANIASSLALFLALSTGTVYAANEWTGANIVDESLTSVDLATGTIGTTRIKNESVLDSDLAPNSVTASEIALGAVRAEEIASNAVEATEIADNSIDSGEIIDNSLTAADLAANAVGTSEVANNSLTGDDLAGADKTGAISVGALSNARCTTIIGSVSGAKVGDAVALSINGSIPSGMLIYGQGVTTANQVNIKVCNLTGATSSAISNLPVTVLTFTP